VCKKMSCAATLATVPPTDETGLLSQLLELARSHTGERCQIAMATCVPAAKRALLAQTYAALRKSATATSAPVRATVRLPSAFFETDLPELANFETDLFAAVDNDDIPLAAPGGIFLVESTGVCAAALVQCIDGALGGRGCVILIGDSDESAATARLDAALRQLGKPGAPITRRFVRPRDTTTIASAARAITKEDDVPW
jgi:hypothetical protein